MAAYSLDLRKRIVEAVERQVGSKREIARVFGVHESFLYKLLRQQRERGDLAPLPHGGGVQAKLSEGQWQQVASWITTTPDATLAELQEQLQQKLRVRVGLSSGRVIAGDIGTRSLGYAETGGHVGMAQRMESVAPPGGVVLSESTARLVEHAAVLADPEWLHI